MAAASYPQPLNLSRDIRHSASAPRAHTNDGGEKTEQVYTHPPVAW